MYDTPNTKINHYKALNTAPIKQIIYTYKKIYVNVIRKKSFDFDKVINDNLKSEFKLDFIGEFENKQYKLITNHNLNTSFFKYF